MWWSILTHRSLGWCWSAAHYSSRWSMVDFYLTFIELESQSVHYLISQTHFSMHVLASWLKIKLACFSLHLSYQSSIFGHHEIYGTDCSRRSRWLRTFVEMDVLVNVLDEHFHHLWRLSQLLSRFPWVWCSQLWAWWSLFRLQQILLWARSTLVQLGPFHRPSSRLRLLELGALRCRHPSMSIWAPAPWCVRCSRWTSWPAPTPWSNLIGVEHPVRRTSDHGWLLLMQYPGHLLHAPSF